MSSQETTPPTPVTSYDADDPYPRYQLRVVVDPPAGTREEPVVVHGPHTVPLGRRTFDSLEITRLTIVDGAPHLQIKIR